MQSINVQTSLGAIYEDTPKLLRQLKEHIKMETLIPKGFYKTYYKTIGRPRGNKLESFIWFFQLENIIGIADDTVFLRVLQCSRELRKFCGVVKVPKPSDITTFRERFGGCIELMLLTLVDIIEPICWKLNAKKSDYLMYDTTGVLANIKENNPKFFNAKLSQAKKLAKDNPDYDPCNGSVVSSDTGASFMATSSVLQLPLLVNDFSSLFEQAATYNAKIVQISKIVTLFKFFIKTPFITDSFQN